MKDQKSNNDTKAYLKKRAFFEKVLTIYGRNAVIEALKDKSLVIHKLHLSTSNRPSPQLTYMLELANQRGIDVAYHDKKALSHISKNAKQDQGVALDIVMQHFMRTKEFLAHSDSYRILALEAIHNPQNLGMIIRSATAGNIDAIIIPTKNSAQISPLVIKASVGTLFKMPIIQTDNFIKTLEQFKQKGAKLYSLSSHATQNYQTVNYPNQTLFILGNESEGVSREVEALSDASIAIPMNRGVESLNVAVTASLLAFL